MLDPKNASVVFTPLDRRNQCHPTVGRCMIVETGDVAHCLDPAPVPATHEVFARPVQGSTFKEQMPIVPADEADPLRGMLLTATRLISLDGLDAAVVFSAFGAHLVGWAEAVEDDRPRHHQRVATR